MRFSRTQIPTRYCEACGKLLTPQIYRDGGQESIPEFKKRRFCNHSCKGLLQRLPNGPRLGGLPHRGRKIARRKKKRECCEKCGRKDRLEVHHRDEDATNNDLKNLQVLCLGCHRREHKNSGC